MTFNRIFMRIKRTLLCDKRERKSCLDIGEPTNIRVMDVIDSLPGLTDAQRKQIRESASNGALHLQSLQSHPPLSLPQLNGSSSRLPSIVTEPVQHNSADADAASSSRLSSDTVPDDAPVALLDVASKDHPNSIPTSPPHTQSGSSTPVVRVTSMWNSERRYSSDSSGEGGTSHKMDPHEKKHAEDSPRRLNMDEGSEIQDTVHDTHEDKEDRGTDMESSAVRRAGKDVEVEHKRDSNTHVESFTAGGEELLVAN